MESVKPGYKKPHVFPNESFIAEAVQRHFKLAGFEAEAEGDIDVVCIHPNGEQWRIEVKGHTASIGLDFNTGLGQLLCRMDGSACQYAIAVPAIPQFLKVCRKIHAVTRRALNLHVLFVESNGNVATEWPFDETAGTAPAQLQVESPATIHKYVEELTLKVASDLIGMYPSTKATSPYGLIFPEKRDGSLRISEQESKLLFVQHLTVDRRLLSVETPTKETYVQSGTHPLSARVDLTLYAPDRTPEAHIELKAHNCPVENIRKDLEKLLRERNIGVWFHTLERSDGATLSTLIGKFRQAFDSVAEHVATSNREFLFCFVVLESALCYRGWLRLTQNESANDAAVRKMFACMDEDAGWSIETFRTVDQMQVKMRTGSKSSVRGKGTRTAYFVFVPSVNPDTFLHLSVRGGSYRLRRFAIEEGRAVAKAFMLPDCATFESLRDSGLILRWIDVNEGDLTHAIENDAAYWHERIGAINTTELKRSASVSGG